MVKRYIMEFREFLGRYAIIGIAIAFVMGGATTELSKSTVNDIIMPFINPLVSNSGWEEAVLNIGPIAVKIGSFLSALLNFLLLALVVFIIAKVLLKEEKPDKK